jgi:uncharacterized protein
MNARGRPLAAKVAVAGGPGAGKTAFVSVVSQIGAVTTDVIVTSNDDDAPVGAAKTTTAAIDFGRVCLASGFVVYMFGAPGQQRFWAMWDTVTDGAIGAVLLVDVRRLADCFGPLDYFEQRRLPFAVVVNEFDGAPTYCPDALREALMIGQNVPVLSCDARDRSTATAALEALIRHARAVHSASVAEPST